MLKCCGIVYVAVKKNQIHGLTLIGRLASVRKSDKSMASKLKPHVKQIIALRRADMSWTEIAEELKKVGCMTSSQHLCRWMKSAGARWDKIAREIRPYDLLAQASLPVGFLVGASQPVEASSAFYPPEPVAPPAAKRSPKPASKVSGVPSEPESSKGSDPAPEQGGGDDVAEVPQPSDVILPKVKRPLAVPKRVCKMTPSEKAVLASGGVDAGATISDLQAVVASDPTRHIMSSEELPIHAAMAAVEAEAGKVIEAESNPADEPKAGAVPAKKFIFNREDSEGSMRAKEIATPRIELKEQPL